ncbi:MAG: hypothetical protein P8Y70_05810 [Candidatus Lokiarchaeota archaeon]
MPLEEKHLLKFLDNPVNDRFSSELLDLVIDRINTLCFKECQVDRIQCTLTPLCTRRFLLKLRIKNGLKIEDLPKFCYEVHKGVVERDFRGKTVVYKPQDAYLYLVDFLDIYFHGDYRKLNKFISLKKWDDALKIFNERIKKEEDFRYYQTENYFIIKYEDHLHIIFINEGYVLCNANRENIKDLELIKGISELYSKASFQEANIRILHEKMVRLIVKIPHDVLSRVKSDFSNEEDNIEESDNYFWNVFHEDLQNLTQHCQKISLKMNITQDLRIELFLNKESNNYLDHAKKIPLRFKDLEEVLAFIDKVYNKFYVIWV